MKPSDPHCSAAVEIDRSGEIHDSFPYHSLLIGAEDDYHVRIVKTGGAGNVEFAGYFPS